jgi:hypothetical protein
MAEAQFNTRSRFGVHPHLRKFERFNLMKIEIEYCGM